MPSVPKYERLQHATLAGCIDKAGDYRDSAEARHLEKLEIIALIDRVHDVDYLWHGHPIPVRPTEQHRKWLTRVPDITGKPPRLALINSGPVPRSNK